MRILGIKSGLQRTGFDIIDAEGERLRYVASGPIATAEAPLRHLPARQKIIVDGIGEVVRRWLRW
jgi:crossover junction endodeoxyribonuclease RuvC